MTTHSPRYYGGHIENCGYKPALAFMVIDSVLVPGLSRGSDRVELSWILKHNRATRNLIEKFGGKITER